MVGITLILRKFSKVEIGAGTFRPPPPQGGIGLKLTVRKETYNSILLKSVSYCYCYCLTINGMFLSLPGSHLYPKVELIFILDSSSSVGRENFRKVRRFVSKLVQEFSVNPSATQVSVVSYAAKPRLDVPLSGYVNKECTIKKIQSLRYTLLYMYPTTTCFISINFQVFKII